jgi:hypothetical protein
MSFPDFFFSTDGDGHWYKVPTYLAKEWSTWINLPEPKAYDSSNPASEAEWNAYDTPPEGAERCEHPSNYVVREV